MLATRKRNSLFKSCSTMSATSSRLITIKSRNWLAPKIGVGQTCPGERLLAAERKNQERKSNPRSIRAEDALPRSRKGRAAEICALPGYARLNFPLPQDRHRRGPEPCRHRDRATQS